MANIAHNFNKLLLAFLLLTGLQPAAAAPDVLLKDARSGALLYDPAVDFSKYDKVILYPVARDTVKIENAANSEDLKHWDEFGEDEWKKIAERFDASAHKKFNNSNVFTLTEKPGEGVLTIQFRMIEFKPNVKNSRDNALGTVGESHNLEGLGTLRLQGVLLDSTDKRLLAVIESLNDISAGKYAGGNVRAASNMAWHKSFQRITGWLHDDMEKLRSLKPVQEAPSPQSGAPATTSH
jgi:hypothetical protein